MAHWVIVDWSVCVSVVLRRTGSVTILRLFNEYSTVGTSGPAWQMIGVSSSVLSGDDKAGTNGVSAEHISSVLYAYPILIRSVRAGG